MRLIRILRINYSIRKEGIKSITQIEGQAPNPHDPASRRFKHFPLLPESNFVAIWNVILIFILFLTIIFVPIRVTFVQDNPLSWEIFDIVLDVFFGIDIVMNFLSAYYNTQKKLILSFRDIAFNYIKGYFVIDAIALIPFDRFTNFSFNKLFRLLRLPRIYKINRALSVSNISSDYCIIIYLNKIQQSVNIRRAIEIFMLMFILSHLGACLWYSTVYLSDPEEEKWVNRYFYFYF